MGGGAEGAVDWAHTAVANNGNTNRAREKQRSFIGIYIKSRLRWVRHRTNITRRTKTARVGAKTKFCHPYSQGQAGFGQRRTSYSNDTSTENFPFAPGATQCRPFSFSGE